MMVEPASHSTEARAGLRSTISPQQSSTMLPPILKFLTECMLLSRTIRPSVCQAVQFLLALRNRTHMRLEVERAATSQCAQITRTLFLQDVIMDILPATTTVLGRNVISLSGPKRQLAGERKTRSIVSSGLFPPCSHLTTPMCFMLLVIMYFAQPMRGAVGKLLAPISPAMMSPGWSLLVDRSPWITQVPSSTAQSLPLLSRLSSGVFSGLAPMMV